MPQPPAPRVAMQRVLTETVEALEQMARVLQEETERLKSRRVDGLEQLLGTKLSLAQTLERCEQDRRRVVGEAGFGSDPVGMRDFLGRWADAELNDHWEQMTALLKQVHLINQANGMVINGSLAQVQRQLALLRGDGPAAAGVYDTQGQTRGSGGGREITRA